MIWFQILEMQRNFHKWPFTPNTLTKIRNHLTFWRIRGLLIRICTTSFTIFIWSNYDPLKIRFRGGPCVYILLCTNQITSYEIHMNLKTSSWNSDMFLKISGQFSTEKTFKKTEHGIWKNLSKGKQNWRWNLKTSSKRTQNGMQNLKKPFKKNVTLDSQNIFFLSHYFLFTLWITLKSWPTLHPKTWLKSGVILAHTVINTII